MECGVAAAGVRRCSRDGGWVIVAGDDDGHVRGAAADGRTQVVERVVTGGVSAARRGRRRRLYVGVAEGRLVALDRQTGDEGGS